MLSPDQFPGGRAPARVADDGLRSSHVDEVIAPQENALGSLHRRSRRDEVELSESYRASLAFQRQQQEAVAQEQARWAQWEDEAELRRAASAATRPRGEAVRPSTSAEPGSGVWDSLSSSFTHQMPAKFSDALGDGLNQLGYPRLGAFADDNRRNLERDRDRLYQRPDDAPTDVVGALGDGNFSGAAKGILYNGTDNMGATVPAIATGIAKRAPVIAAVGATANFATKLSDLRAERRAKGLDDTLSALDYANAATQVLIDVFPYGEKTVGSAYRTLKEIGPADVAKIAKAVGLDATTEGVKEIMQSGLTMLGTAYEGGNYTPTEIVKRFANEFLTGGPTRVAPAIGARVVPPAVRSARDGAVEVTARATEGVALDPHLNFPFPLEHPSGNALPSPRQSAAPRASKPQQSRRPTRSHQNQH